MRIFAFAAILALAPLGLSQKLSGVYKSAGTTPVSWSINPHETLMWGDAPYLPIGLEVDGSPAAIEAAKASGIEDVVVDLPVSGSGWSGALATLEKEHMRYLIRISSLTPSATGIVVDPASFRIADAQGPQKLDLPMPGASEALVVAAQKRDGTIIKWMRVPIENDRLQCDVPIPTTLEAVVLVFPTEGSLALPDYWEGLDEARDRLLQSLKANPPGPGLRGFINPLGNSPMLPNHDLKVVPKSSAFRTEMATFLETKYRNVVGALRAWGMPTDVISSNETGEDKSAILTFEDLARMVPLWSGNRGIGQIYDPVKKVLYTCDNLHSSIWKDYSDEVSGAESRRYQRIVAAIREIDDVPVVQEWAGWAVPYEGTNPAVDGVAIRAVGSSKDILNTAAKAASSDLRWSSPGWLNATDIKVNASDAATQVDAIVEDLISVGARGIFFSPSSTEVVKSVAAEWTRRKTDTSPSQGSPSPTFFPENATNPAEPQKLPDGFWWLPAPFDGDRIDLGNGFYAYRMSTPKGITIAIWADKQQRVLLRVIDTKKFIASDIHGFSPDPKVEKGGVEVTLSPSPLVISGINEIPIPDPAYLSTMAEIYVLLDQAKAKHKDLTEATMALTDAQLGFERNPGGEFVKMRKLLHELDAFMGRFSWSEAELPLETNFSEISELPGTSNNRALRLHPMISCPSGFFATYDVPVHTTDDEVVWLAAKIDPEDRPNLTVDISGQHLAITDPPVGMYGSGFGWYRLGTTKNAIGTARVKILVNGATPDLDTDAIMLAPIDFNPIGINFPEINVAMNATPKAKKNPGRKGRNQTPTATN